MPGLKLFAEPWWVNLLLLVPLICGYAWQRRRLLVAGRQLALAASFGIAFGFVEAAVVVYLRAAVGLLPGFEGSLDDAARHAGEFYRQTEAVLPQSLLAVEILREAATLLVLLAVSALAAGTGRERWAMFLWIFALWDLAYYAGLWAMARWPQSLLDTDILFLIPEPWIAQVWFPLLVSSLTAGAVLLGARGESRSSSRIAP
jgi:hypothetical protein